MIVDALLFDDMYRKNVTFQFIPAEYITHFSIRPDESGNGQSVLQDALTYAKLYLSLLIFNMMTIINKGNDTRVYYVKNSGMDTDMMNATQNVARQIKGRQISFHDLMNANSMVTKLGANKEIFTPMGANGDKAIDFDILSGQDVQLHSDLMEMLRNNFLNATGIPSAILETENNVEFAKQLSMVNAKFIGIVIGLQMDFNPSITELYRKLLKYCSSLSDEDIMAVQYKLTPPRELNVENVSNRIGNIQSVVQAMTTAYFGENQEQTPLSNKLKDKLTEKLIRSQLPYLDWEFADESLEELEILARQEEMQDKLNSDDGGDDAGGGY